MDWLWTKGKEKYLMKCTEFNDDVSQQRNSNLLVVH